MQLKDKLEEEFEELRCPLWVHLPETMLTALHLLKEVISDFA